MTKLTFNLRSLHGTKDLLAPHMLSGLPGPVFFYQYGLACWLRCCGDHIVFCVTNTNFRFISNILLFLVALSLVGQESIFVSLGQSQITHSWKPRPRHPAFSNRTSPSQVLHFSFSLSAPKMQLNAIITYWVVTSVETADFGSLRILAHDAPVSVVSSSAVKRFPQNLRVRGRQSTLFLVFVPFVPGILN